MKVYDLKTLKPSITLGKMLVLTLILFIAKLLVPGITTAILFGIAVAGTLLCIISLWKQSIRGQKKTKRISTYNPKKHEIHYIYENGQYRVYFTEKRRRAF